MKKLPLKKRVRTKESLAPDTTIQQDMTYAGQRKINIVWEYTQAFIAIIVVVSNVLVGVLYAIRGVGMNDYPSVLSSSLFLVIGFYFGRTNHTAIGGVGKKPATEEGYTGR